MAIHLRRGSSPRLSTRVHISADQRAAAPWLRLVLAFAGVAALLFLIQYAAFEATRISVQVTIRGQDARFHIDGSTLTVNLPAVPSRVLFIPGSPLLREYQIDGTDSTNNFTEDASYVAHIAGQPYVRFQDWMRDATSYSSWRDVSLRADSASGSVMQLPASQGQADVALPRGQPATVSASLLRLEAPANVLILCDTVPCGTLSINRNDRYLRASTLLPDGTVVGQAQTFFPTISTPFAAEIVYLLAHVALWLLALLVLFIVIQVTLTTALTRLRCDTPALVSADATKAPAGRDSLLSRRLRVRGDWDRLAIVTCVLSFAFTCYIALVQYHAQPHILDASAYVMQAKIFATGHLSVPAPTNLAAFQGPFMVAHDGRWFAQYAPGTSLLLAAGFLLRVPWLVEPVLGTLALWGIYCLGRLWYGKATAWLALLLGALSPFYSYLAATYLSHVPALCFEVYFLLCLMRYGRTLRRGDLLLAAGCWSGLLLTREMSALLLGVAGLGIVVVCHDRRLWRQRGRVSRDGLAALAVALCGCGAYLLYNFAQTGSALLTPRALFSPADRLGFGAGIGFYGQHTIAAGLVNLDELLTSLSIDLYGWPFYLTLVFIPLALLGRRSRRRLDLCCLATIALLALAQVAYFYHGIYLGPRYLFDTLPFVLLLTARGITNASRLLAQCGGIAQSVTGTIARAYSRLSARVIVLACLVTLLLCNLLYYLPRQLTIHTDFSGLPATQPVDVAAIYANRPTNAVVLTHDWYIYNYVVWPLNDPALSGTTLYAYAATSDAIKTLRLAYPERNFYLLSVAPDGGVHLESVVP